jgi:hypothetical protein
MTQTSLGEGHPPEDEQVPETSDMWVADGLQAPDLGARDDAPPAYGEHHDQLQLSQVGFEAGAAVTGEEIQMRKWEELPLPDKVANLQGP